MFLIKWFSGWLPGVLDGGFGGGSGVGRMLAGDESDARAEIDPDG